MQIRSNWGLLVLLVVVGSVGCSQGRQTIRAQSPSVSQVSSATNPDGIPVDAAYPGQGPIIGTAPGYGDHVHGSRAKHSHRDFKAHTGFRDNNFGYEGGFYAGPEGYYTEHDRTYTTNQGGCPNCDYGNACPSNGCPTCGHHIAHVLGHGPNGFPTHYQTYDYRWPQNQVYPVGPLPAGMVQYPYYTLRGPTDFFMK